MKVHELIKFLSEHPQDVDVLAGQLGEYIPTYSRVTSAKYCEHSQSVMIAAGTEPPDEQIPYEDTTVGELLYMLSSNKLDLNMPIRANFI